MMVMMHDTAKMALQAVFVFIAVSWGIPAQAKDMVIDMASSDAIKTITVPVYPGRPTIFYFPHNVREAYSNRAGGIEINHVNTIVGVVLQRRSRGGTATFVTEKWRVGVSFEVVKHSSEAVVQVAFRDVDLGLSIGRDLYYRPVMEPATQESQGDGLMHVDIGTSRSLRRDLYCQVEIRTPAADRFDSRSTTSTRSWPGNG